MTHRHAVHEAREVQREMRHVEHPLVRRRRIPPAARRARRPAPLRTMSSGNLSWPAGTGVCVVNTQRCRTASRSASSSSKCFRPSSCRSSSCKREQRRMPFVQVIDRAVVVAHRLEQRRAAHAQHDLLAEPIVLVATVERVGERAIPLAVLREIVSSR